MRAASMFALMALALGGGLPAAARRPEDGDDSEPEGWRERQSRPDRMGCGEECCYPRPMPPADLERWRAAEAKRERKAARRRGGR